MKKQKNNEKKTASVSKIAVDIAAFMGQRRRWCEVRKKEIPKLYPDRTERLEEIADRVLSIIDEYEASALDFLEIVKYTKKEGLKQFKL